MGHDPVDTTCDWGCVSDATPHCFQMDPSGGGAMHNDLNDPNSQLAAVTTVFNTTIDGDAGTISNGIRTSNAQGIHSGIDFEQRGPGNSIAVFRFASLDIEGQLELVGSRPIVLVSIHGITVRGLIDAQGSCNGTSAGPGGGRGGGANADGTGQGAGTAGRSSGADATGGGGGGNGAAGGDSGDADGGLPRGAGGTAFGTMAITTLAGGGGGGGGATSNVAMMGTGGSGGGGGGGIQLLANQQIDFAVGAQINVNGCGGAQSIAGGAGGGGAGGDVLIEAPSISVSAFDVYTLIAANGGGGGGVGANAGRGQNGQMSTSRANGGTGDVAGGKGGANGTNTGSNGGDGGAVSGAGGGGVGWIRVNTRTNTVDFANSTLSPNQATATTGMVAGQ
jgi:hypothetical protein